MSSTRNVLGEPADQHSVSPDFNEALRIRRDLVYDYLDNWPGSDNFKPAEIHDALFSYVRQRGKGLRPALLLLSCGAAGGDEKQALPAAAAVEVYQTWTLVHDDIIDRDQTRRGKPTVHAHYAALARDQYAMSPEEANHYGLAVGILAGDLQQSWVYSLISDLGSTGVSPDTTMALISRMSGELTPTLLEGEMLDVQYATSPPHTLRESEVLHMLSCKTAALLEYSAWAGATIGVGARTDRDHVAERLGRFAFLCGIAFQLHDDILGLTADESVLGKPVGSDIREGKRTLVVYRALARLSGQDRTQLLATLGNASATTGEVSRSLQIVQESGAIGEVRDLANSYISQALAVLDAVPVSDYRLLLASWASYVLARKY